MVELYFRGKRKDTGQWIYSGSVGRSQKDPYHAAEYYLGAGTPSLSKCDEKGNIKYVLPRDGCLMYSIIPETFGPFIGEHDKDGRMIFEGDIYVDTRHKNGKQSPVGVVRYEKGGYYPFAVPGRGLCVSASDCLIIGNVFDNPELLEDIKYA